jgi:FkbM family methyltransferase
MTPEKFYRFPLLCDPLLWVRDRIALRRGEAELRLLPLLVGPGQTAVDVGANNGLYVHWLLRTGCTVIGVEPNPVLARLLARRFAGARAAGRLTLETCALGTTTGALDLHIPRAGAGLASLLADNVAGVPGGADVVKVATRRLDDLAPGGADFVKIDVEGFETDVLKGAPILLRRDRPSLIVEIEERHAPGAVQTIRALLALLDYRGFFFDGGRLQPIERFDPARHQKRSALNEAGTRRTKGEVYINNFVFAARPPVLEALARLETSAA